MQTSMNRTVPRNLIGFALILFVTASVAAQYADKIEIKPSEPIYQYTEEKTTTVTVYGSGYDPPSGAIIDSTRLIYGESGEQPVTLYYYHYSEEKTETITLDPPRIIGNTDPVYKDIDIDTPNANSPDELIDKAEPLAIGGEPETNLGGAEGKAGDIIIDLGNARIKSNGAGLASITQGKTLENYQVAVNSETNITVEDPEGDPVHLASGTFTTSSTDLSVKRFGIMVSHVRRYSSHSAILGRMGRGWFYSFDSRIILGTEPNIGPFADLLEDYYIAAQGYHTAAVSRLSDVKLQVNELEGIINPIKVQYDATILGIQTWLDDNPDAHSKVVSKLQSDLDDLETNLDEIITPFVTRMNTLKASYPVLEQNISDIQTIVGNLYTKWQDALDRKALSESISGSRNNAGEPIENNPAWLSSGVASLVWVDELGVPHFFRAQEEPNYSSTSVYANGQPNYYPTGVTFSSSLPNEATVELAPDGSFTVTERDGRRLDYDFSGRLSAIRYLNPVIINFEYNGDNLASLLINGEELYTFRNSTAGYITDIIGPEGLKVSYSYDELGRLVSVTDTAGFTVDYSYTDTLLTRITKPDGSYRQYFYDLVGGRTVQYLNIDEEGASERFSYNFATRTNSFTNPSGVTTIHVFDENQREVEVQYADGGVLIKEYDDIGNLIKTTDQLKNVIKMTYDGNRNRTSVLYPDGASESWSYGVWNKVTSYTDRKGLVTSYQYDSVGNLVAVYYPDGTNELFSRDNFGQVTHYIDRRGTNFTYSYDDLGYLQSMINPNGKVSFVRDDLGKILSKTDEKGNTWLYQYNDDGRMILATNPMGATEHWQYDNRKDLVRYIDQRGNETIYEYDNRHLLEKVISPEGDTIRYEYRPDGKMELQVVNEMSSTSYIYDATGRLHKKRQIELGIETEYLYDKAGRLHTEYDPRRFKTIYQHDSMGRVTIVDREIEPDVYISYRYGYDEEGRLNSITDARGKVTTIDFNPVFRERVVTDPLFAVTRQELDPYGLLLREIDPDGNSVEIEYNFRGQRTRTIDGAGNATQFSYDERGFLSQFTDANGAVTQFKNDDLGRVTAIINPEGNREERTYDAAGNLETITDGRGNITTYEYDKVNRVSAKIDPLGNRVEYEYHDLGGIEQVIDPADNVWKTNFDALGRIVSTEDPTGVMVHYQYDVAGNVLMQEQPGGLITQFTYDGRNLPVTKIGPDKEMWVYEYDEIGNLIEEKAPGAGSYLWSYDDAGRLVTEEDRLGHKKRYSYTPAGRINEVVDFEGSSTSYSYDSRGLMTTREYNDGTEARFLYDKAGRLTGATTPDTALSWQYDQAGRLITNIDHRIGEQLAFTYDGAGNRTSISYQETGRTLEFRYDERNLLIGVVDADGLESRLFYDELGREVGRDLPDGTVEQRAFDAAGRLAWYRIGYGEFPTESTTGPSIDMPSIGQGNGHAWGRWKNPHSWWHWSKNKGHGRGKLFELIQELTQNWGNWWLGEGMSSGSAIFTTLSAMGYAYDDAGRRSASVDQDGNITTYEYNDAGRLAQVSYPRRSGKAQADWEELQHLGIKSPSDTPWSEPNSQWLYVDNNDWDQLQTLFDVVKENRWDNLSTYNRVWVEEFTYDSRGNRATKTTPWGIVDYDYNQENRLLQAGNRSYSYDGNGNLISESTLFEQVTYGYTAENRMSKVVKEDSVGRVGTVNYVYDALGRRSQKSSQNDLEAYLYTGFGFQTAGVYAIGPEDPQILQRELRSPSVQAPSSPDRNSFWGKNRNLPGEVRVLEEHQWVNGDIYAVRGRGNPILSYQHHDALGSVVYTSRYGLPGKSISYDAFGVPLKGLDLFSEGHDWDWDDDLEWWKLFDNDEPTLSRDTDEALHFDIAERFGYNGKLLDEATGLYDYGYRHYAPTTARFTTVDPIKDGRNWYVYVGNDPVNFIDPLGLLSETPGNGKAEEPAPSPFLAPVINGMAYPVGMKNGSDYPAGYDYGPREPITTPIGVTDNFHDGIDITAPEGTRANAVGDGVVTYTGTDTIFGNYITIQHPNGTSTLYAHLKDNFVEDGDDVQAGQHIGNVGQTGQATGSHLHLGYDANGDGDFGDQWIDNPTVLIGSSP